MFIAVKIGYAMIIVCLLLMTWAIMVKASPVALGSGVINYPMSLGAQQDASDSIQYPPCAFNPLCTCSKAVPDLGIVSCRDVPLARLPPSLNSSKIFILRLENNGLRWIEPQLLQSTGLYRLQISDNPLPEIPDDSLMGLERSLWELALQRNKLTSVPNRAIRYMQRLRLLDLTGNDIYELSSDSFRGLEQSLLTLVLADNSINALPPGAFSELSRLETLDLRGNALQNLDASALPPRIQHLSLADNLLSKMPVAALKTGMQSLDLSRNRLVKIYPEEEDDDTDLESSVVGDTTQGGNKKNKGNSDYPRISLDVLRLEYNFITELEEASFRTFTSINYTFLDGNPINTLHNYAFKDATIRDLSMRDCGINTLPLNVFGGLENSLHYLDLSSNNLKELPHGMLARLPNLRGLNLRDNRVKIEPNMFDHDYSGAIPVNVKQSNRNADTSNKKNVIGNANNLHHLDISGREMEMFSSVPEMMEPWTGLREISFGRFKGGKKLSPEDFTELSPDVEELNFINSGLTGINAHAFRNARGVRRLDFSENSIKNLDNDAFVEIGHSLDELRMHRALKMDSIPAKAFMHLTGTKEIDLSANGLKTIPESSFMALKSLRRIRMHDNHIGRIPKGLFLPETHMYLEDADFSFNAIDHVYVDTFKGLTSLRQIRLDDNKIAAMEPKSYADLPRLRFLDLQGNRVNELNTDTFQNLPELEELDISYNMLKQLNFAALDQVGTLASLCFNVSHNKLTELKPVNVMISNNNNNYNNQGNYHVNVKTMDISFNNITEIAGGFFRPIETALTYLMLGHNSITNVTREAFGNMPHLQWLDLSHNKLREVDFDAFRHTRRLQVLFMDHNELAEIPAETFHSLTEMRVVSFAHNQLRQLPDGLLFAASNMERLDVSNNQLTRVPIGVFSSGSGRSLCELDLSGNQIAALQPNDAVNRFKSLTFLDLSDNRLTRLDDSTFLGMSQLSSLHLSFNNFDSYGLSSALAALDSSPRLVELSLAGLNLDTLPSLPPLPALRELHAQYNILPALPSDLAANLTGLRMLDVRDNSLNTLGQVGLGGGLILPQLRSLKIANNPLGLITDACLATATRLGELDIRNLTQLTAIETGALSKMNHLRTLKVGTFNMARDFNIPRLIKHNIALKNLFVELDSREKDLNDKMNGIFPTKLSAVYFTGKSLKSIGNNVLQGIRSPMLHIGIHNTSVETIPKAFFNQLGRTRNLTLDVRNNTIKSMANPNSGERPGAPKAVFLTHLQMSGNNWNCDCELGWVEVWQRKKRQFLCPGGDRNKCEYGAEDDLRNSKCENKQRTSLIEVLKADLECGWSSGSVSLTAQKAVAIIPAIALIIMSVLY